MQNVLSLPFPTFQLLRETCPMIVRATRHILSQARSTWSTFRLHLLTALRCHEDQSRSGESTPTSSTSITTESPKKIFCGCMTALEHFLGMPHLSTCKADPLNPLPR